MTIMLNSKPSKKVETTISKHTIELINSLGGPPLGYTNDLNQLKVSLENHAAAHVPLWSLNVLEQTLKRQGFKSKTRTPKLNNYMSIG